MTYRFNEKVMVELRYLKDLRELVLLTIQKKSKGEWVSKSTTLRSISTMKHLSLDTILVVLEEEGLIQMQQKGTNRFLIRSTTTPERKKQ